MATVGLSLVVEYLPRVVEDPCDRRTREALCLATDLGGYAIMTGGTNGGHLTSFSLVDLLPHGRACGLMNPYYTVFFGPAIEPALRLIGDVFRDARLTDVDFDGLRGRELAVAVAETMLAFARDLGLPTRLGDVEGFSPAHIDRALAAAKDVQLRMKLQGMPVPMTAETVDEYMGSVLEAARDGNLEAVKNVP
jgi:alcohol dehydrogenase